MKEPPRKELRLLRITTKNEDQIRDRNSGLEVRISKEEATTIITTALEVPSIITRFSLPDQTPLMGLTAPKTEDRLINARISHSIETMKVDLEMDLLTTRMGTGETMKIFLVPYRPKGETSHKITPIAKQEVINPKTLRSDNRSTTSFTPYEQKFPQNNNQTSSNVVRLTTTDDTINELSDICPLNY